MQRISNRKLADLLVEHAAEKPRAEMTKVIQSFVKELAALGLMHQWRNIEHELHGAWKRKFGAANITVVSAHGITATARRMLEELAPGADLVERVDERLMGGAIVRIDDRRIDGSLMGALQRLKQTLDRSAS